MQQLSTATNAEAKFLVDLFILTVKTVELSRAVVVCSPTPRVTWKRIGAEMPHRHRMESFGHRLTIDDIHYSDAGKYECQGINDMTMVPVRRSMHLSVECEYLCLFTE